MDTGSLNDATLRGHLVLLARTYREHLHSYPELRWKEDSSLQYVRDQIQQAQRFFPEIGEESFNIKNWSDFKGGVVIDVTVDEKLPRHILRADIDALPIQEATGLPFASQNAGVMHACGHDLHTGWLLATLIGIIEGRIVPTRNFRFVFQRAEENPITESGGACLVREGVCDDVESAIGLHVLSTAPRGVFLSREGRMMANSDRFEVKVKCRGGHVMNPDSGSNAIVIGNWIISALMDGFVENILGPNEPCVLEPTISNSGTASNIRPGEGSFWFGCRNFLPSDKREALRDAINAEVQKVVAHFPDATAELNYIYGHPALHNNAEQVREIGKLLKNEGLMVGVQEEMFGGEDFAHYLNAVRGSFWFLGAADLEKDPDPADHHENRFNPADVYEQAIEFWHTIVTAPIDAYPNI